MASSSSDPDANPQALPAGLTPDSVDVPSELYTIVSRLRYTDKNGAATNGDGDSNKAGANTPAGGLPGSTPSGGAIHPTGGSDIRSLSTKDLTAATDPLKHKIQRARAAVHTLPDVTRTIAEQEAEIKEWEDKIESQRKVLQQLKEFGIKFSHGSTDVEMGGTGAQGGGDSLG
ncbi:putative microtubule-associated protein [Diaporthe ampelina]|uniref:Mediator of RNA polymerase II transcription subunit 9 n=1 Tax=Diaporthe ampelina TaxID=1214573 RepID=A0A0G2F9S5_9PEZI|nr:putative microtubule-associated protein [Diaporthe ampelina]